MFVGGSGRPYSHNGSDVGRHERVTGGPSITRWDSTSPLLGDTAFGSVTGLITSRLDLVATGSYTSGTVGFSGDDNGYGTASAVASLRFAVSRHLATYAEYFYYHYDFGQSVTLPGYLPPRLDRQGVTVGLTAWLPLIGSRGRR